MGGPLRSTSAEVVYHALNRVNIRQTLVENKGDSAACGGVTWKSDSKSGLQRLRGNDPEEGRRGDDVNGLKSFQVEKFFISGHQVRGLRFYGGGKDHQIVRILNRSRHGCCSRHYHGGTCKQGHKIMNVFSR